MGFHFPDVLRLWDSLLADPSRFSFVESFATAMVLALRPLLMDDETDFGTAIKMLQNYPHDVPFHHVFALAISVRDDMYTPPPPSASANNAAGTGVSSSASASASASSVASSASSSVTSFLSR